MAQVAEDLTICPPNRFTIWILHPGHPNTALIGFSALVRNSASEWGVDHQLALDACFILSQNCPGFLASTSSRETRIDLEVAVLTAPDYFYHLEAEASQYPIVNKFDAWRPTAPPAHWYTAVAASRIHPPTRNISDVSASEVSAYVKAEDEHRCFISGFPGRVQTVYLVPKAHQTWFEFHRQGEYNVNQQVVSPHDISNGISLRADLHIALDSSAFVFAPFCGKIVVYFLKQLPIYTSIHHVVEMTVPTRLSVNHLYSRFAYNIIKCSPQADQECHIAQLIPVPHALQELRENAKQGKSTGASQSSASSHASDAEVQEYPDTDVLVDGVDADMKVLKSKWIAEHPQIWQMADREEKQGLMTDDEWPSSEPNEDNLRISLAPSELGGLSHVETTGSSFKLSDLEIQASN